MTQKAKFLKKINEAFAKGNTDFIIGNVTEDIIWTIHGDRLFQGIKEFTDALKEMKSAEPFELSIKNIITHGDSAAVDGTLKSADGKTYAFCDVYKFRGVQES